jgi:CheY-like chemotaxis protein
MNLPTRDDSGTRSEPEVRGNASPTRRVLVVDDSRDARSILQLLLTKLGHQARTAEDAQTGIAISRDFQPEIVLCDLMMAGGMSGYAFAKAAREEQDLAGICIVAVSGWDGPEYERQAYDAGFDQLMKKPIGLTDLQQILQSPPRNRLKNSSPDPEAGPKDANEPRRSF